MMLNRLLRRLGVMVVPRPPSAKMLHEHANISECHHPSPCRRRRRRGGEPAVTLTITDLFCGAGGSSSGAEQVPGVRVRMAANHWALAVETHNHNLPHADHDTADISQVEPRRYPRTDILWASPECTNHSQAKGKRRTDQQPDLFGDALPDEAAVRSRATMWDVLRFAEIHRYRAIVVENVVDVRDWVMWPAWVTGLDNLGYDHQVVYLNSMFAQQAGPPAPQSRDRLYVVAWRRGDRAPDLSRWTRPPAWCPSCDADGPPDPGVEAPRPATRPVRGAVRVPLPDRPVPRCAGVPGCPPGGRRDRLVAEG
jgi:site-specific DNA-cytosine methylase